VKVEIRVKFKTGEIVMDCVVLDKVKFEAPKLLYSGSNFRALSLSRYDK